MIPIISVIMPVYNGSLYLKEAIESVLNQTFKDFEFIIINDGSIDGSSKIIQEYVDKRIIFYDYNSNEGITSRLNQGLAAARGKYIARMDCDDISVANRFEVQHNFMEANREIAICGSLIKFIGEENRYVNWVNEVNPQEIKINLLFNNAICHPSIIMRREILGNIKYDFTYPHAEDYELWARLSKQFKLANIPQVLLYYRATNHQVSVLKNIVQQETQRRIIKEQLLLLSIIPSKIELEIHLWLHSKNVIISADYLFKINNWNSKLKYANAKFKIYDEIKFVIYLEKIMKENTKKFELQLSKLTFKELLIYYIKKAINWSSIK